MFAREAEREIKRKRKRVQERSRRREIKRERELRRDQKTRRANLDVSVDDRVAVEKGETRSNVEGVVRQLREWEGRG